MGEMISVVYYLSIPCLGNKPSDNERDGNVSPSEISLVLTPRSESFTLQPSQSDSDQFSDNGSFWLAGITPPLWDTDSSDSDSDIEQAKDAIQNESSALAEVCGIFDCLDQLQSSESRSCASAGSTDGHTARNKFFNGQVCLSCLFSSFSLISIRQLAITTIVLSLSLGLVL